MRRAIGLGLAMAALAAPPAGAFEVTTYAVTVEGKGSYQRHDESRGNGGKLLWTTDDRAAFTFTGTIPQVVFYDDKVITGSAGDTASVELSEAVREHVGYDSKGGATYGSCTGEHLLRAATAPQLAPSTRVDDETGRPGIDLRLIDDVTVDLDACTGGMRPEHHDMGLAVEHRHALGDGPLDAFFGLPPEAVGMGKVIQLVRRQVVGEQCPFHSRQTQGCVFSWEATVTFTRTSKESYPDGPLTEDDIPMPGEPRLRPDGRRASAAVTCPAGCTGTVVAKAGSRVLARTPVRLAAGAQPQRVTVRFGRPDARAVRRAGRVRLAFTLRTATGRPVRHVVTARR